MKKMVSTELTNANIATVKDLLADTSSKLGGLSKRFGPLSPDDRYPRFATAANLVDVILGRAKNGSPATTGARVVELLEAAYRSAASGGQAISVGDLD
jgi:hypothetical protein